MYGPSPGMAYNVRFTYPGSQPDSVADEAPVAEEEGRYKLSGTRSLRPSRISDDGRHTYIEWPRDRTLPAVYAIDPEGRESLVNGAMRDELFVIDSVVSKLVFRIDDNIARADRFIPKKKKREAGLMATNQPPAIPAPCPPARRGRRPAVVARPRGGPSNLASHRRRAAGLILFAVLDSRRRETASRRFG